MITYLRYRRDEERRSPADRFGALNDDDPLVGETCAACHEPLRLGDRPTLFAVGPDDLVSAAADAAGRWYNALAVVMHQRCAWGEPEPEEPR